MTKSRRMMKAFVFLSPGLASLESKPIPAARPLEAIVKIQLASICSADLNTVRGTFPVTSGLTLGHEAVGTIHELGDQVTGYTLGQRVLVSGNNPCGQCTHCLSGNWTHCSSGSAQGLLGRTADGTQAEYVRVPNAQANLTVLPESVSNDQGILLPEVASSGFAAVERGRVQLGDNVAVFGQGSVGLCASLGAKLRGAAQVLAVDASEGRLKLSRRFGASSTLSEAGAVSEVLRLTNGIGVDVAIETNEEHRAFDTALRVLRPGGTLSTLGYLRTPLTMGEDSFDGGFGNYLLVNSLCPGGKARLERLVRLVETNRIDLSPLLTHCFPLEDCGKAYDLLSSQSEHAIKVSIQVS